MGRVLGGEQWAGACATVIRVGGQRRDAVDATRREGGRGFPASATAEENNKLTGSGQTDVEEKGGS